MTDREWGLINGGELTVPRFDRTVGRVIRAFAPGAPQKIVADYTSVGFAVFRVDDQYSSAETLLKVASTVGLRVPFVPPLYRVGSSATASNLGVNLLTAPSSGSHADHPFSQTAGQAFHCDATLQTLGEVRTTAILCEHDGASGGLSTFFNSTAAFLKLLAEDEEAAEVLLKPAILRRKATVNGSNDVTYGPAFGMVGGVLVSRFSQQPTDEWAPETEHERALIERAISFMNDAQHEGSEFRYDLRLAPGQGLVFANDRIAHGRTAYEDSAGHRRVLHRALFLERPTFGDR